MENIKKRCPDIFSTYTLITEFGHFIHAHASWAVSDIEYILETSEGLPKTALIHVGADMFLRQAYSSNKKNYRLSVLDKNNAIKTGKKQK